MLTLVRVIVVVVVATFGLFWLRQYASGAGTSWEFFWHWLQALAAGEWGRSTRTGEFVREAVLRRVPLTSGLTAVTIVLSLLSAAGVAFWQASKTHPSSWVMTLLGWIQAIPVYVLALVLIAFFSLYLNWLPGIVFWILPHEANAWMVPFALPVACLWLVHSAFYFWALMHELSSVPGPARAELTFSYVVGRGLSIAALHLPYLVAWVLVMESVFAIPGVARMVQLGVYFNDLPFLVGGALSLIVLLALLRMMLAGMATVLAAGLTAPGRAVGPTVDLRLVHSRGLATELVTRYTLPVTWLGCLLTAAGLAAIGWFIDPALTNMSEPFSRPSVAHWLGTDALGRDQLTLLVHGAVPMLIACTATATLLTLLVHLAHLVSTRATRLRRMGNGIVALLIDAIALIPIIVLLMMAVHWYGLHWLTYISALTVALLPELRAPLMPLVRWTWGTALAIFCLMQASALAWMGAAGFLGFGRHVAAADWGAAIASGREHLLYAPQVSLLPALALCVTIWAWRSVATTLLAHDRSLYAKTESIDD